MGYGDDIMATGLARGAAARGKRIAFGDGKRIIWGPWSEEMFRHNPNIAPPGSENQLNLEWVPHYKGRRSYNSLDEKNNRWIWNYNFKPVPGEFFFSQDERQFADSVGRDFILIEPNVPWQKSVAVNKDWGLKNYQTIASLLLSDGYEVVQFDYGRDKLNGVRFIHAPTFRHALAALSRAKRALMPEGGLHHGAAAVDTFAVVIFGGFIPPAVTGYDFHVNLTGGAEACGSIQPCVHCRRAMLEISVEEVYRMINLEIPDVSARRA